MNAHNTTRDAVDYTAVDHASAPEPDDSRKPKKVAGIKAKSWKYVAKRSVAKFTADAATDMAATLTYFAVLSLFPAILALVSILGLVGQAEQTTKVMLDLVSQLTDEKMVKAISGPVENLISSPAAGWTFAFGLAAALWSASKYVGGFSRAMNRIYGTDEGRPVWKLRPALLLVTLVSVVLVAAMALMLVVSGPIARAIGETIGLGDTAVMVWNTAKWPVLGVLAVVLIALLYYFTPNVRQPKFRWISVGATVALLGALVASAGFGFYLANFNKYEKTYGAIAGVIILLLWLWILNLALLFGAEVDAELERGRQLQAGIVAEADLRLPPRAITASLKKTEKEMVLVAEGKHLREQFNADSPDSATDKSGEAKALWWLAAAGTAVLAVVSWRERRQRSEKD
ncbi:YihY/virulence factor BrkB family protein [Arthrobacter sp. H35-D1]|uniref:YihY/virulence factor BrkB family protein n=1 Tax=Arthrobacter sp. H35-D1 TaxID=3046202 RepID=UPI0024B93328|nr:YihY/virulence factor BrkB family protein [Arthrobacter sp. H35-D1]MDJ0314836.1 YihY/virulence factor BrkB family protein [Arthrobacter sp. H35-D1]